MSQQILRITRPTKIELIRLKRRLRVAKRLHKVLKDRLIILTQELISVVKDALSLRMEVNELVSRCFSDLLESLLISRYEEVESYGSSRLSKLFINVGSRVVAGTRVPLVEVEREANRKPLSRYVPASLVKCGECFDELIDKVARLAELEESIVRLGAEVARVKRRVNALENVLIPRMENTIKFLEMKFEEREREDKMRLKKVKEILARRS